MITELTIDEIQSVSGAVDPLSTAIIAGTEAAGFSIGVAYSVAVIGFGALGYGVGTMIYAGWSSWYYSRPRRNEIRG